MGSVIKNLTFNEFFSPSEDSICVLGGGNSERILEIVEGELILGSKIPVNYSSSLGGGGLNYTLDLMSVKRKVFPILAIGNDAVGKRIKKKLLTSLKRNVFDSSCLEFISSNKFLCDKYKTPESIIINERQKLRRTILKEITEDINLTDFYFDRVNSIPLNSKHFCCLMIGHLPFVNGAQELLQYAVSKFKKHGALIFINFGNTQLLQGYSYWEKYIENVDMLQFNLREAFQFFFSINEPKISFEKLVKKIRSIPITTIITLGKLGAIVITNLLNEIIFVKPYSNLNVVDYTGAGDAFGAGLINVLSEKSVLSIENLYHGLLAGRIFAAYACTTPKSYFDSISSTEIENLIKKEKDQNPIDTLKNLNTFKFISVSNTH